MEYDPHTDSIQVTKFHVISSFVQVISTSISLFLELLVCLLLIVTLFKKNLCRLCYVSNSRFSWIVPLVESKWAELDCIFGPILSSLFR